MAEHKFISDEEWERQFDEKIEAQRIKEWEEWERTHPEEMEKRRQEQEKKNKEVLVGTGYGNIKRPQTVELPNGQTDKWGHGEIFYPHPEWWKNPEYMEAEE